MGRAGGVGQRRAAARRHAWEDLLGGLGDVTELTKLTPDRVDAVAEPAAGIGFLMIKSLGAGLPVLLPGVSAEAERSYALSVLRDGTSMEARVAAQAALDRLGLPRAAAPPRQAPPQAGARFTARVIKAEGERRFTLCVGYPAWRPDTQRAQDGFRDMASDRAVEDAAWSFLAKSPEVGLLHADGSSGAGKVCESYIYRGPSPWVIKSPGGGEHAVCEGDWVLGIIWGPRAWEEIRSGRLRGVSLQGHGERRMPSAESLARVRERGA